MTLHMLQLQPDMAASMRWAGTQGLLGSRSDDLGYVWHALLSAVFGPLAPKPFALVERPGRPAALLGYAAHDAPALRDYAALFAFPDAAAAACVSALAGKAMPDRFREGQRLGFSVRIRPIVRVDGAGGRTTVRERDAFLHAIADVPSTTLIDRSVVYRDWLVRRLVDGGAVAETVSLDAIRRTRVVRRARDRSLREPEGPDVTASGVLHVTDPNLFAALLARGVGRHRAFGFGMLLLRPC